MHKWNLDPGFQHTNCKNFLKGIYETNGEVELWLEINLYEVAILHYLGR